MMYSATCRFPIAVIRVPDSDSGIVVAKLEENAFSFFEGHIAGSKSIKTDITFAFFIYKTNFACCRNTFKWREINMHILHTHSFTVHLALTRRN